MESINIKSGIKQNIFFITAADDFRKANIQQRQL